MKNQIVIGRGSGCDILVPAEYVNVSRQHARVSIVNGNYLFEDISSNGSYVNGQFINGQRLIIAPNTQVLLANTFPLPWRQIQTLLPLQPVVAETDNSYGANDIPTHVNQPHTPVVNVINQPPPPAPQEELGCLLSGVCFLWPLVGWILYFVWKDDHNSKAKKAAKLAWIGFGVSFGLILLYYLVLIIIAVSLS